VMAQRGKRSPVAQGSPQVMVLNGASSSGKSTLATELQSRLEERGSRSGSMT
jgi:adenylylsulfate kinase-like enzyme